MKKNILLNRSIAKEPCGLRDYKKVSLKGIWWLVMPEKCLDVLFLQMLGSHERYANFDGEGILVSDHAMPQFSQN